MNSNLMLEDEKMNELQEECENLLPFGSRQHVCPLYPQTQMTFAVS